MRSPPARQQAPCARRHSAKQCRCSDECELRARRLAARLGTPEAALLRFMDARERLQRARAGRGATPAAQPARAEPKFAAGREGTPIMLSQVKVRGGLRC